MPYTGKSLTDFICFLYGECRVSRIYGGIDFMKVKIVILLIFLFVLRLDFYIFSLDDERMQLEDIAKNVENYRNKITTLRLRLKNFDNIFEKLIFYDQNNNDIIFDISSLKMKDQFKREILNLHEGMEYLVSFIVKDVVDSVEIEGELVSFKPIILLKLPEGNNKDR